MSTWVWKGAGYGIPFSANGMQAAFRKTIDVPWLIAKADKAGLALDGAENVGVALASTGFAANDILEVFMPPKGTIVKGMGEYLITAEGGTCTINAGVTSTTETHDLGGDIDGFGVFNLNDTAGTVDGTDDDDGYGTDNYPAGILFVTNGSLDIEFNNATDVAEFEIWADAMWIGDLAALVD